MAKGKPRWSDRFNNLPIDRKLLFVFVAPMILMLVISLGAVQLSLNVYDAKFGQTTFKELEYFIDKVDGAFSKIETLSYQMAMDDATQQSLYHNIQIKDYSKYQYEMRFVMLRFLQQVTVSNAVDCFIYTDGARMEYTNGNKVVEVPKNVYQHMLQSAHDARGKLVFRGPTRQFPYLLAARDIRYYINADLTYLGTLVLVTDFSNVIAPYEKTLGVGQNYLFVEDGRTQIYASAPKLADSVRNLVDPLPNRGYAIRNVDGRLYFIGTAHSSVTGWRFVDMFPYQALFSSSIRTRVVLILGFIALYVLAIFAVRGLSRRITGPVKELSESMAIVGEGRFDEALVLLGKDFPNDEVGRLKDDYAIMLKTIRDLIRDNYEKQLLIKDTQYRALKAQINPHFLYNTLNSVGWMVDLARYEEARQMITSLGKLLHRAFKPDTMTTVDDETTLLMDYIFVQKIRYEERVEFSLDLESGLGPVPMPQMLLQPLVENSIYHAVDVAVGLCHISVSIARRDGMLDIAVRDDGPGMDKANLARVRSFDYEQTSSGIGLRNIRDRLSLIYGPRFTFSIDSEEHRGTTVNIAIPAGEETS